MKRLGLRVTVTCLLLGLTACTSVPSTPGRLTVDRPAPAPIDFGPPTTPQPAEKAAPVGDRTQQALRAVAARDHRVVAVGFDESDNVSRPLFLSSDDAGRTWTRRRPDRDSLERSQTFEGVADVAGGPAGFAAIGDGPRTVLWHSADGTTWQRLPEDPKVIRETDYLRAITATPSGFAMVGGSSVGGHHLVYWQSADGVSWRRSEGPPIGLKQTAPGEVTGDQIAASGKTVVIAGNLSTPNDADHRDRLQYWYSVDGGRHFRAAAIKGEIATDYSVYNNVLAFGDGKFVALAQGSGFDEEHNSWDAVVVEGGPTGTSWQVAAKPWMLGSAYDDSPGSLVKAGQDWLATAQVTAGSVDVTVAVGPTWAQLADDTDAPSQRARGTQLVTGSVAVGNDVVMVGSNDRTGSTEPAIWRYAESRVTPVALPADLFAGRPSSHVNALVIAGKDLVAVGDVANAPTGWTRTGLSWQATTLPGRKNNVTTQLNNAVATADGRVVAVGEKSLPIERRAAVWVRGRNGAWTATESPVFGVGTRSPYGGPHANAVAVGPSGWVVVGKREDGDRHVDAWSAYSKDGRTWIEGVGGKVLPARTDPDDDTRRPVGQNLRTTGTGDAEMTAVIAVGPRFVAAGDRGDGSPAVWLSPNGSDWKTVVNLPLAKGVHSASVNRLGRIGNTLVVDGQYERTQDDPDGGWITWTSKDGGLTWTNQIAVPSKASAGELIPVPNGLVALGYTGTDDDTDAAAWFSRDGRTWKAVDVPGDRAKGRGRQGLVSGVVQNGKLLAAAYDVPPVGGGYYTLEMELPR